MTLRIVQPGTGDPRDLVALFLVGPHMDPALCAAIGPGPCIVADAGAKGPETLATVYKFARDRALFRHVGRLVLGGWSMGVQRIRGLLKDGAACVAVVAADGTHNDAQPVTWKTAIWSSLADRARRGEVVAAFSHTFNTYVEQLKVGAYLSTVSELRRATGLPLTDGGPRRFTPVEHHDGELHVYSYASDPIDAAAHVAQQRIALPLMLERHVRPLFEEAAPVSSSPAVASDRPATPPPAPNGTRVLQVNDKGADVGEWQVLVASLGYSPGKIDRAFGPLTAGATRAFQQSVGLPATGIVDADTRRAAHADRSTRYPDPTPPDRIEPGSLEVPRRLTSLSPVELRDHVAAGHLAAFGVAPSPGRLRAAWSMLAVEHDGGRAIHNGNIGNVMKGSDWPGPWFSMKSREVLDGRDVDVRSKWRAFPAPDAEAWWRFLERRFPGALVAFDTGNADSVALALKSGGYMTEDAAKYAAGMRARGRGYPEP